MGSGYSLFGQVQVSATQVIAYRPVVLSFVAQGTFVYALSYVEQERIKSLIKGVTTQEAMRFLTSLKGVKQVFLQWSDNAKLPKDPRNIHLVFITEA